MRRLSNVYPNDDPILDSFVVIITFFIMNQFFQFVEIKGDAFHHMEPNDDSIIEIVRLLVLITYWLLEYINIGGSSPIHPLFSSN